VGVSRARGRLFRSSLFEEVFVTLEMNHVDGVRIRLPMACSVIAAIVLLGFLLLVLASYLAETNPAPTPGGGGGKRLPSRWAEGGLRTELRRV